MVKKASGAPHDDAPRALNNHSVARLFELSDFSQNAEWVLLDLRQYYFGNLEITVE